MMIGNVLIWAGVIGIVAGITFHLQGRAIIGPEASFMYDTLEWQGYGIAISIIGIIIIGVGYIANKKTSH